MALSGVIKKDFHKSGVFTLQIEWEATQNIANNTSTITAEMYLISNTDGGTISSSTGKNGQIIIDGTTFAVTGVNVSLSAHQKKLLATKVHTITHNPDGTRNFIISGSLDINVTLSGTYYGTISITGATFTLDTIPRASTITSFPNFTIGNNFSVTINRASSGFTHKLELKYDSTLIATRTGIGASTTFTLSTPEENTLYNAMKNVTSGTVTLYCTTYDGGTQVGNSTSKTATASVDSSIVPSFDTIAHSDVSTDIAAVFGAYIQGKSRLNLEITGAAGAKYSTIVSYKIEFNQEVFNSRTGVSGYIKGSGNLSIKGTVTDSRGRTYSKTTTITVLAYTAPKINSFRVDRCDEDGTLNSSGEYAKVSVSGEYKSLNDHNTILLTIYSKTRNISTYTEQYTDEPDPAFANDYVIGTYDLSTSFDFKITLEDYFEPAESTVVLATAKVVLDLGREGVGIGKYHEHGALDVLGDSFFLGDMTIDGTISSDDFESGIWTPELTSLDGLTVSTYYSRYGRYIRIKNLVYIHSYVRTTNISGDGDYYCITGIPFTATNDAGQMLAVNSTLTEVEGGRVRGSAIELKNYGGGSVSAVNADTDRFLYYAGVYEILG